MSYTIGTGNDGFVPNAAPVNVVTADFNGDHKLDLAVAKTSDNSVYILLGKGNGAFQPPMKFAAGESIQGGLRVGDFNNDHKLDLFLPTLAPGYPAIVMLGNGDGSFKPAINSSSFSVAGTYPRGWALGDFNKDGKLDVVATLPGNSDTGGYIILLGNGNGTFKPGVATTGVLGYSRWVTTGDFNHDGNVDLAFADGQQINGSAGNAELSIALGNGNGTFRPTVHYSSPGLPSSDTLNPEDVVVGDVNGDGKLDAIVSNYDDNINVFLGNGNGTFRAAVGYSPGEYPRDVAIADINGDGKADLVVNNLGIGAGGAEFPAEGYQPGSVAVMLGNGNGTFRSPIAYQPFDYPGWTAVGDFNGDKSPDLAISQVFDGHSVAVMLNSPTSRNLPPIVAIDAAAAPNPVNGKTATLSVLGADDGGESNLKYTWATTVSPPGPVVFSVNGTNSAKNTTVSFSKAGTYYFKVTITDASGLSAIDMVPLTVAGLGTGGSTFIWTGAGTNNNWSNAANWNMHTIPGLGATVIFNATSSKDAIVDAAFAGTVGVLQINSGYTGTVSLSRNLTLTGSFAESAGTFSEGTYSLFDAGDFTKVGGTFNAGKGAVVMNGTAANQNISATDVNFYNFTLANSAHSLNVTGTLTVNGTFTWLRTAGWILGPNASGNAAIECRGDIDNQNHGNTGTPYFTLDGAANQTIKDTSGVLNYSGYAGGDFRRLVINKTGGAVILACDPVIYNGLSLLKGSVSSGGNWWFVGNESIATAAGLNLGNLTLAANIAAGELGTGLQVASLNLNGHTLVAPSTLYISGNFNAGGTASVFSANSGTVVFDGSSAQQLTSGGNSFYNLTILSGAVLELEDDLTIAHTFTNGGSLNKNSHKLNGQ
ncbi:MAG TPA: FG-GAP-like repeat-containing protein [Humisphaera sp.]|nr:FG-GAP-like repeat-containing protein [Humisphaera sp.]